LDVERSTPSVELSDGRNKGKNMHRLKPLFCLLISSVLLIPPLGCERRDAEQLVIAIQSDGRSLDPHHVTDAPAMRLIENMYSTLFRYTAEYGEFEPDLVEEYDISGDNLVYTFRLRRGVRFHNSDREMSAGDVKYSLRRIMDGGARADQFAAIDRIETPDEHTVEIHLSRPSAALIAHLAYPMNAIVDREVVEANNGSLDTADAGTGPFQLVQWRRDQHLILERNPHFHVQDRPHLNRIVFRPIPDDTARSTALRNREVHLILDVAEKDVDLVQRAGHVTVESIPGTFWEYIGLNTESEPFDNEQVRQAIAWAIDREAINQIVKFGRSTVLTGGHIPPDHWAHADLDAYPVRDLDRARALLAEAGFADGFSTTLKVGSDWQFQVDAATIVQQQLAEIGIEVQVMAMESGIFFNDLNERNFDMTLVGWVGFVDPDEWTYDLFHSTGRYNQQNYSSERLDQLLEQGRATLDREQRRQIYAQVQRIVAEEAPVVFLYLNAQTSAYLDSVRGYQVHPTATTLWLREAQLDQ
jgi:peptide/nickel transport system substrate-binding protein